MSRVMRFDYFCDNVERKHPRGERAADTILAWSPKHSEVRELEVCDGCLAKLTYPEIQALADAFGRRLTEPEEDPDLVCPFGCNNAKPYKSRGGLSHHMTSKHPDWEG